MKKGMEPPPADYPVEVPAPPYPGPPQDHNVSVQPPPQPPPQPPAQPPAQPPPQPPAQPVAQDAPKSFPQPVAQPVAQTFAQPAQPQVIPQQPQVVQTVSPVVMMQHLPRDVSGQMHCPHCQTPVVTTVSYKIGVMTWWICVLAALIGCWPCYIIPFFVDACKDVEHSCPSCNKVIHVHRRMWRSYY